MEGDFIETPCQNFEEVPQTMVAIETVSKITRPPLKMASLKDAKAVIEEGGSTIWGQLPDICTSLINWFGFLFRGSKGCST